MEEGDRLRVGGAALEGGVEARPAPAEEPRQPGGGEAEIDPEPRFANPLTGSPLFLDDALAFARRSGARQAADDVLLSQSLEADRVGDREEQEQLGILLHADKHIGL